MSSFTITSSSCPHPNQSVFYYQTNSGQIELGTVDDFKRLTGADYVQTVVATPSQETHWKVSSAEIAALPKSLPPSYGNCFFNVPPEIYLGKDPDPHVECGWDVFARQDFDCFQGVTVYGGEFEETPSGDIEYLMGQVNGKKVRNLGPMINDGFPNCVALPYTHEGLSYPLFITIRKIQKNERLLCNYGYGHHSSKLSKAHFELDKAGLKEFISSLATNTAEKLLNDLIADRKNHSLITFVARVSKLSYLLETPSSWLYLLSEGISPKPIVQLLCQKERLLEQVGLRTKNFDERYDFALQCFMMHSCLRDNFVENQQLATDIRQFLHLSSTKYPAIVFMNASHFLCRNVRKIRCQQEWDVFKSDLNPFFELLTMLSSISLCDSASEIPQAKIRELFKQLSDKNKKAVALDQMRQIAAQLSSPRAPALKGLAFLLERER